MHMSRHTALGTTECTILKYFMMASCAESSEGAPVHTIFPLANMSAVVEGVLSLNFAAAKLSGLNSPYFFHDISSRSRGVPKKAVATQFLMMIGDGRRFFL